MARSLRLRTLCLLAIVLLAPATAWSQAQCAIPNEALIATGIGKDAIPALTTPRIVSAADGDAFWEPEDRVLGVVRNGVARAYPLPILWWHEIINDLLGEVPIAVTYCPLTGSGLVYDPVIDGTAVRFGTSGLLFENNLVMYDRGREETLWSQMQVEGICGPREGRRPNLYPVVQTTWRAWKAMHPDTTVLTRNTGYDRDYDLYPYGKYDEVNNTELLYPLSFKDPRLPMKALVHGIVHEGTARAYSFDSLARQGARVAINDRVNGRPVLVVFDRDNELMVAFDRRPRVLKKKGKWKRKMLQLEVVEVGSFPFSLRDRKSGTLFDLTGKPIEGKLVGKIEGGGLEPIPGAYTAFWFAWAVFNRGTELY